MSQLPRAAPGDAPGHPAAPPRGPDPVAARNAGARPARGPHEAPARGGGAFCRRLTRASDSSFYYSFLLLPRARRQAMYAIYAFCRAVDDAVDVGPGGDASAELSLWREELRRCFAGEPRHPIARQIALYSERFGLREGHFLEILHGVEMDLEHDRYERFEDLFRYCYRVAGVVGLLCARVFGHRHRLTLDYAVSLGVGFQLVNILRDLRSDAGRGRIYVPLEDLRRFDCSEAELLEGRPGAGFEPLMRFECERARELLLHARRLLPPEDRRAMWPAESMAAVYERILELIEAGPRRVLAGPIAVARWRRAGLALAARLGR